MKHSGIIFVAAVVMALCLILITVATKEVEKRRRGELYMLDVVGARVSQNINHGGQIPSDWQAVSNAVIGSQGIESSQYNPITSAAKLYSVLAHPVAFSNVLYTGSIFLVRTKPEGWGSYSGRWALVGSTNRVSRVWIAEQDLMPEVRSQVGNESGGGR